jgi:hypothetical protein
VSRAGSYASSSSKSETPSGAIEQQPEPSCHRDEDGCEVSGPNDEILHHSACAAHPPVVRNQAAHAVSGHEAQSEDRRHKFNELDHRKPPVVGEPQYRAAVRQKYDDRGFVECPDLMHCVETSAI